MDTFEEKILLDLRNGSIEAYEYIFNAHWKSLYKIANGRLRSETEAKEVVQELFVALWEKRDSLQEISAWGVEFQERREEYFDQLLMKIDIVTKDISYMQVGRDAITFEEIEGDLLFIVRELDEIDNTLAKSHFIAESDRQFFLGRLEGILDHLEEIDHSTLPTQLRMRIEILKSRVDIALGFMN